MTFGDKRCANMLLMVNHPLEAKSIGRTVKNFKKDVWFNCRNEIVPKILYEIFSQNPELKTWLLLTVETKLAEIAIEEINGQYKVILNKDKIWGLGIKSSHQTITKPGIWEKYGEIFFGKTHVC